MIIPVRQFNVSRLVSLVTPRALAAVCLAMPLLAGCASSPSSSPYAPLTELQRDPARAQRLTLEATEFIDSDSEQAETLLREALTFDLYHGPAHNNLGAIFLQRGDLFSAASEFEWARKLMPGHPDPRLNLALTLEQAGRTDEAITTYATALEVYPEHLPTMQALSRLRIMSGRTNDTGSEPTLAFMLDHIAMRGETDHWKSWARIQRLKLDH
ncbi:MAG: tetratricopeptide repeat protein [Phycisphaerales bacterium]|nr:tetratricopeptide repeat protein [Phycisphaerales bacterium]